MNDRLVFVRQILGLLAAVAATPTRVMELADRLFAWARAPRFLSYNQPPGGGGYGPPGGGGYGPPGGGYGPPGGGGYGPPGGPPGYGVQPGYGAPVGHGPSGFGPPPGYVAPQANAAGPAPSPALRIIAGVFTIGTCLLVLFVGGIVALIGAVVGIADKAVGCDKQRLTENVAEHCKDLGTGNSIMLVGGVTVAVSILGVIFAAFCIAGKSWAAIASGIVMSALSGLAFWSMTLHKDGFVFHWYVLFELAVVVLCFAAYPGNKKYEAWKANGGR